MSPLPSVLSRLKRIGTRHLRHNTPRYHRVSVVLDPRQVCIGFHALTAHITPSLTDGLRERSTKAQK